MTAGGTSSQTEHEKVVEDVEDIHKAAHGTGSIPAPEDHGTCPLAEDACSEVVASLEREEGRIVADDAMRLNVYSAVVDCAEALEQVDQGGLG